MDSGLSRNLAERALALRARGVPPEILAATKRAIMNALGAAALGSHRSAMTAAIGYASDQSVGISGGALIPWHSDRLSVADAAFITGAMIHLAVDETTYFWNSDGGPRLTPAEAATVMPPGSQVLAERNGDVAAVVRLNSLERARRSFQ